MTPDPSFVLGPTKLGRMFGKSRWWALRLLRTWWKEQQEGGPVRTFRVAGGGALRTTTATVDLYMPRRRDEALERRLAGIEKDLGALVTRVADLERAIGRRR